MPWTSIYDKMKTQIYDALVEKVDNLVSSVMEKKCKNVGNDLRSELNLKLSAIETKIEKEKNKLQ